MTLVVPTRCTLSTVVFPLTSCTLSASFPLLFHRFVEAVVFVAVCVSVAVHVLVRSVDREGWALVARLC